MNPHPNGPHDDRDELSPVDAALGEAIARAGRELQDVPADVAHGHLDAITSLASEQAHVAPAPAPVPAPGWRSRLRRVAGLTAFKVAVGAGVAAAGTTGGLAATGHLPAPVQQVVSDGAGWFGLDLPAPTTETADPSDAEDQQQVPDEETTPPSAGTRETDRPHGPVVPGPADGARPDQVTPEPRPAEPRSGSTPADPGSRPDPDPDAEPDRPAPPATQPEPASPGPGGGEAPPGPPAAESQESSGQATPGSPPESGQQQPDADDGRPEGRAGGADQADRPGSG